jgi:hypothetical protein
MSAVTAFTPSTQCPFFTRFPNDGEAIGFPDYPNHRVN